MNRRERRRAAAAEFTGATRKQAMCPCCNARKVALHVLKNLNDEEATASWCYGVEPYADDPEHLVADFGVLHLGIYKDDGRLVVHSFGERVFQMTTTGGFTIEREGPWIGTLAAIEADLARRFGPAMLGGEHLH